MDPARESRIDASPSAATSPSATPSATPQPDRVAGRRLLKALILPPGCALVPIACGLMVLAFARGDAGAVQRVGLAAIALGAVLLLLVSLPAVADRLCAALIRHPPLQGDDPRLAPPGVVRALIVLDAGRFDGARAQRDGIDVAPATLVRLRHAAALHRRHGWPLFPIGDGAGARMADVLQQDFATAPPRWLDAAACTTVDSARRAARRFAPGARIVLVTHAWHMRRAVEAFARAGFDVVPAPCGVGAPARDARGVFRWLPHADALARSRQALHEHLGRARGCRVDRSGNKTR
ncbi:MAG: YdcF family protein [Acidobacteriota bacterium]